MRLTAILCVALTGCATTLDPNFAVQMEAYRLTITSNQGVEIARARAEEARYNAMATIAERSDGPTKSMALLALAMSGRGVDTHGATMPVNLPRIPETAEDRALKWAAIFSGPTTALVSSYFGYRLGRVQSDNQAETTQASYGALVAMKPAPVTPLPITDSHNVNNIWTTTDVWNRDGNVLVGTGDVNATRPIAIVPPVVPIVPVVTSP